MRRGQAFAAFRERAFWIAFVITLLAVIGLFVVFNLQPSPDPAVRAREKNLSPEWFNTLQTLLTTAISIGLISMVFEVLLREKYGEGLRRFLDIKSSMVRSGLVGLDFGDRFPWTEAAHASEIRVLARDPSPWLLPNLGSLLDAAERRKATIFIGLPDPNGTNLRQIAETVGLTDAQLRNNIEVCIDAITNQWTSRRSRLKAGSSVRVVAYDEIPLVEIVANENQVSCFISQAVGHKAGLLPIYTTFDQVESVFPGEFIKDPLDSIASNNELWAGDTP